MERPMLMDFYHQRALFIAATGNASTIHTHAHVSRSVCLSIFGDWRLTTLLILSLPFISTYFITLMKAETALRSKKDARHPPTFPYWVPLLGHGMSLIWNPADLVASVAIFSGTSVPIRLRILAMEVYLLSGSDNLNSIWKNSKWLTSKAGVLIAVGNMFKTPKDALKFYESDNSGINLQPHPDSNVMPEHRIYYHTHKATVDFLSGSHLKSLASSFQVNLRKRIHNSDIGYDWVDRPDLFLFLQSEIFYAALESLCGPHMLSLNPTFVEDFWNFDKGMIHLLKGYPRWLIPGSWSLREKCLDAVKKWHAFANEYGDETMAKADNAQDPIYGTKLMRARQDYFSKMSSMTADAIASADLGIIWGTNSNSIPAAFWFLFEVIRDPSLLARVRDEVDASLSESATSEDPDFDISRLCNQPLLQSIYAETLRLRVAVLIIRSAEHEDFNFRNWTFSKNKIIAVSSHTAHMDKDIWSSGAGNSHPLKEFWSDRFLVYPDRPSSGPSRRRFDSRSEKRRSIPTMDHGEAPRFSFDGTASSWVPYGGGQRVCPGRHFAKQEILLSFAMMCTAFDIELRTEGKVKHEADMRFYGLGTLPPKGQIPFRIRRRTT